HRFPNHEWERPSRLSRLFPQHRPRYDARASAQGSVRVLALRGSNREPDDPLGPAGGCPLRITLEEPQQGERRACPNWIGARREPARHRGIASLSVRAGWWSVGDNGVPPTSGCWDFLYLADLGQHADN